MKPELRETVTVVFLMGLMSLFVFGLVMFCARDWPNCPDPNDHTRDLCPENKR